MTALCLHYAIRPSFIHPSSLSPPPSSLALFPVACFCVRISLCMDLGGVNSLGMFRVCRFCVSASPAGPLAPIGLGVHSPAHMICCRGGVGIGLWFTR